MSEFEGKRVVKVENDTSVPSTTEDTVEEGHDHSHEHGHEHGHDHDHDCPAERIVTPGDIFDIKPDDDAIVIVGTQTKKVTKISGLEEMTQLKVRLCRLLKIVIQY